MEHTAAATLPDDIIIDILHHVSTDSAALFRCAAASKRWRAFVADRAFLRRRQEPNPAAGRPQSAPRAPHHGSHHATTRTLGSGGPPPSGALGSASLSPVIAQRLRRPAIPQGSARRGRSYSCSPSVLLICSLAYIKYIIK
ncbi:hypothetical protein ZWY2020_057355 [Hordeum vulgare]|nr:hypothetical protein ZWY2020_005636 [Hordeum vulgare]KAI4977443.1 hypothetical protein ZWY2020_057355 [Hordeum vulgare]